MEGKGLKFVVLKSSPCKQGDASEFAEQELLQELEMQVEKVSKAQGILKTKAAEAIPYWKLEWTLVTVDSSHSSWSETTFLTFCPTFQPIFTLSFPHNGWILPQS